MLTTLAAAKAINPEVLGVMYINTLMAFPFYQLSGKFAEVQPHTTPPRAHTRTLTHTQIHTQTHTHTHYVHTLPLPRGCPTSSGTIILPLVFCSVLHNTVVVDHDWA